MFTTLHSSTRIGIEQELLIVDQDALAMQNLISELDHSIQQSATQLFFPAELVRLNSNIEPWTEYSTDLFGALHEVQRL